jgi:hypothetical protein
MSKDDQTKELLEKILADLYAKQASVGTPYGDSYLTAQDGQFLGKITDNQYDKDSILNEYGPYGSQYSTTSIFNEYSLYGSPYGQYSVNNPYCSTPPKLVINGTLLGFVTKNQYVANAIPTEGFLYTLRHDIQSLLAGQIIQSQVQARQMSGDSFIQAADGTFLGSLRPNTYDQDSIFNRYGPYGNRYSQTCIFNRYGQYGGRYSSLGPFNPHTSTPPQVYHGGRAFAYLTVNTRLKPRIDPDEIMDWAEQNVRKYG